MAKNDRSARAPEVTRLDGLPFNLEQWIAREMPGDMGSVGNKEVFKHSDFIFMIVKGPNARNDCHIDPSTLGKLGAYLFHKEIEVSDMLKN